MDPPGLPGEFVSIFRQHRFRIVNARLRMALWSLLGGLWLTARVLSAGDAQEEFFETSIRPILANHCLECHGRTDPSGGLRLDSRAGILKGGESGPAVVLGQPDASRLIQAVRHQQGLEMPPEKHLSDAQIAALSRWIKQGAFWPQQHARILTSSEEAARHHWAFQPMQDPVPPLTKRKSWVRNPIDAFILNKLESAGLEPSPQADRRTLIRRVSYTLTGLPPTPEEVEQFVNDPEPDAYERLVDRLLASQHYGEQWARHWLDVARYSDTKGYVYAREERFWVHAWVYRDWVVRAFNEDLPYNRFLLLQIAGDQVADRREHDLAAMGFLTLGRRFLGAQRDIIDDRIDVICRGTMGLTVGCARCHDHKYDPIPTADYYSLYGVFASSREQMVCLADTPMPDPEFDAELKKRQQALEQARQAARKEWSERVRKRVQDYLKAQTELEKYPPKGFDQIFQKSDILPEFVRQWESYLRAAERNGDPIFLPWHRYRVLPEASFSQQAEQVTKTLHSESQKINSLVLEKLTHPPISFDDVITRYGELFSEIEERWQKLLAESRSAGTDPPKRFDNPEMEALRQVLYGPGSPCVVPDLPIVHIEDHLDSATCTNLWKLQGNVDRWIIQSKQAIPFAVVLKDLPRPVEARIFRRGNPANKGEEVPRQMLSLISGPERKPFQSGSGRYELAQAIIHPKNPLTARVFVNRVWAYHFGKGLVATPSDFGIRSAARTHPELLDWLAQWFISEGWSVKKLHQLILTSSTFRQSSFGPSSAKALEQAEMVDPENRWLWRMNAKRLSFEEYRDSLLAAAGVLNLDLGGKPSDLFKPPYPVRRTLYGLVDRQYFPSTLRAFDFANPDLHIPQRPETIVPQQALFTMNHPFVLQQARTLAAMVSSSDTAVEKVQQLYERVFQRRATEDELNQAISFLESIAVPDAEPPSATEQDWQYGYGTYNEQTERVDHWQPLPHFTGSAWQGGPNWPDAKLGWTQLTALGGHPGNDRDHACIRRWTAPREMSIQLQSTLTQQAAPGDGIRAMIVSSRQGRVAYALIHQDTKELGREVLHVQQGETIDFLVDIGKILNSDQFQWKINIREIKENSDGIVWDSVSDFPRDRTSQLGLWEQLAQVLLCSNEFYFVD